jgi:hypothetical protein
MADRLTVGAVAAPDAPRGHKPFELIEDLDPLASQHRML